FPGPETDVIAVTQEPPSVSVHPGDPVSLQCSVLFNAERRTCPAEHSVYWFRAGSDGSHPNFISTNGNSDDEFDKSPEDYSTQKCVYSFSKNISSSDAGSYYCAVAAYGEILFGNGAKLDIKEDIWNLKTAETIIFLLCAALTTSLIVLSVLIYTIRKKMAGCCSDSATACNDEQSQQRDEGSLTYAAPTFTRMKAGRRERKNVNTTQEETVYTDVRVLGIN
ncbi:uncharacterized protein ACNS7B_012089, partial [Menidia menidia]